MILHVSIVLGRTVDDSDLRFDDLCGSHQLSQGSTVASRARRFFEKKKAPYFAIKCVP